MKSFKRSYVMASAMVFIMAAGVSCAFTSYDTEDAKISDISGKLDFMTVSPAPVPSDGIEGEGGSGNNHLAGSAAFNVHN